MSDPNDLHRLGLSQIAQRCGQESDRFFQRQPNDPRFCYELLRRAILEQSQQAWELAYAQYLPLASGWVVRHPQFGATGEEREYLVNCAFEKFWAALTPAKFGRFPDLKSLLRYLQMCVHSTIVDHLRQGGPALAELDLDLDAAEGPDSGTPLDEIQRREFWGWLETRLHGELERKVVYGSFFLALKPRELYSQFEGAFRDVGEIHRIKENVLARLRRDPEIRQYIALDAGKNAGASFSEQ